MFLNICHLGRMGGGWAEGSDHMFDSGQFTGSEHELCISTRSVNTKKPPNKHKNPLAYCWWLPFLVDTTTIYIGQEIDSPSFLFCFKHWFSFTLELHLSRKCSARKQLLEASVS